MNISQALELAEKYNVPRLEAKILIAHILHLQNTMELHMHPNKILSLDEKQYLINHINAYNRNTPIQHITGHKEFWSRDFIVSRDVLIPRQDSELIVESAAKYALTNLHKENEISILDLGTGSGCLLISLLLELEAIGFSSVRGLGIDISQNAINIAVQNAKKHGAELTTSFLQSNWFQALRMRYNQLSNNKMNEEMPAKFAPNLTLDPHQPLIASNIASSHQNLKNNAHSVQPSHHTFAMQPTLTHQHFDIIISNPPYISYDDWEKLAPRVKAEPLLALTDKADGLKHYATIIEEAPEFLKQGESALFLEIGWQQKDAVLSLASSLKDNLATNVHSINVLQDIEKRDRVVCIRFC